MGAAMKYLFGDYLECERHAKELGWERASYRIAVSESTFTGKHLNTDQDEAWRCSTWWSLKPDMRRDITNAYRHASSGELIKEYDLCAADVQHRRGHD